VKIMHRARLRLLGSLVLFLTLPCVAAAQDGRSRILVVNDDGVAHEGIAALAAELRTFADVVVVAPDSDYTGASHSSVIRRIRVELQPYTRDGQLFGYGVNATPADATRFGLLHFGADRPFDLVVSGINEGANTGMIAHYSGTVGAAMEGLYHGVPAIASSQDAGQDYAVSARITADIVRQALREGLPEGVLLSINIPAGELRGVRATPMGGSYFGTGSFRQVGEAEGVLFFRSVGRGAIRGGDETDTAAYLSGYVTVTPLRLDRTDRTTLDRLGGWRLELPLER
jgi:5'-nucleotidase